MMKKINLLELLVLFVFVDPPASSTPTGTLPVYQRHAVVLRSLQAFVFVVLPVGMLLSTAELKLMIIHVIFNG